MNYAIRKLLRHMSWANQQVFRAVIQLPDEALYSYLVNPEWSAAHILQHIAESADWYLFCLTQYPWHLPPVPTTMAEVKLLKEKLLEIDAKILEQADLPEDDLTISEDGEIWLALRSTVLTQTIHHATEHRAQLMDALEARGFTPFSLDDVDVWAFARHERESMNL